MAKPNDELGNKLANSFNSPFHLNSSFMRIAKVQAELQRTLTPYQSIIDATQKYTRMAELSGIASIAQVLNEQTRKWNTNFNGIIGISKLMQEQANAMKPGLTFATGLANSLTKGLSASFPGNYNTAITSIASQHQSLFQNSHKMMSLLASPVASQLSSMQIALNGISGSIARLVAQQGHWSLMDDFENASGQAMELSNQLSEELELSEETERTFLNLVDFVVSFIKRNRKVGIYALRFVELVIMIAAIHQYCYFLKAKPEMATKEDIKRMETHLLKAVSEQLNKEKELRITAHTCRVYLKPNTKSFILLLPKGLDITILQVNHKWAYISFIDPRDSYTQTGWVLKKYLVKANY